jgi:hypothetical protein
MLSKYNSPPAVTQSLQIYFKVRSWKVEDVTAWFRSFSISKEIISRALADGMVDGPSFLALANQTRGGASEIKSN